MRERNKVFLGILLLNFAILIIGCGFGSDSEDSANIRNSQTETRTVELKTGEQSGNLHESFSAAVEKQRAEEDADFAAQVQPALEAMNLGEYGRAVQLADEVIKVHPINDRAYSIKGIALGLDGSPQLGIAATRQAYEINPHNVANYYNMAMVYKLDGNLDDAKYWFERVLERDSKNTWSLYGIATIYADQGHTREALNYLSRAIETDSSVKGVARNQDHFAKFLGNTEFEALTGESR